MKGVTQGLKGVKSCLLPTDKGKKKNRISVRLELNVVRGLSSEEAGNDSQRDLKTEK